MRIVFFGGSFDPPHRGHVVIAMAAADRLGLDEVLVAPTASQPLKRGRATAGYADRLAMVRLACAADPRLIPSELDAARADGRHNYTYDTLCALRDQPGAGTKLFCLLGADSFHSLKHWHRSAELLLLCDFVVATRPGYDLDDLHSRLPEGVAIGGRVDAGDVVEVKLVGAGCESMLYLMRDLEEDVSATVLREALADGNTEMSDAMLPPLVAEYIRDHGLYRHR
jgi:nicotinate-nucleotide adenylyltransferase